ncbi:riboflavin synthase [Aquabacterium soli]|uniref:Riboflavin synthase n=1 Tax=Aquabacterium soli TaxID=2493092 RepID=A0A3R8RZ16_9BURK|nr:riboflavin synthase [Aquabacterium soli]RRS02301.1 riboflavin synthase [Aquabacterium soli]
MFTGIITGVGQIVDSQPLGAEPSHGRRLTVQAPADYLADVGLGDSIAHNGACMTVTHFDAATGRYTIDVSAESLARTAGLDGLGRVNLEKALRANARLDGHLVSGHVDGVGQVVSFQSVGESWELRIAAPRSLARFLAYKGSITVNGVSLTVNSVTDQPDGQAEFSINLIPHTVENTALGDLAAGVRVNLEVDLIARYVERMLTAEGKLPG